MKKKFEEEESKKEATFMEKIQLEEEKEKEDLRVAHETHFERTRIAAGNY